MTTSPWRAARGTWTGLACGLGGVVGHHLVGGTTTPAPALLVVVLCLGGGWLLAGRRIDPAAAFGAALVAQALTHGVLMLGSSGGAHATHGAEAGAGAGAMLVAHLVVAAVSAALAAGGEDALLRLAQGLLRRMVPPQPAPLVLARPGAVAVIRDAAVVRHLWVVGARGSRGPPRGVAPSTSS